MTDTDNKIIEKVRKLLARADEARNDNEHERAIAMRQAHAMLALHGLEMSDIETGGDSDDGLGPMGKTKLDVGIYKWKRVVARSISELYGCFCWQSASDGSRNKTIIIMGKKTRVLTARAMLAYVIESIEREARRYPGPQRTSFGHGAAVGVNQQVIEILARQAQGEIGDIVLTESRALTVVNQHALAIRDAQKAAENLLKFTFSSKPKSYKASVNSAFITGYQHGRSIGLNNQLAGSQQACIGSVA